MATDDFDEPPTVNRYAVVLEPTEAFLEWIHSGPDEDSAVPTLSDLQRECTVYLTPEFQGDPNRWLQRNYKPMLAHALWSWWRDETVWPKDRSFRTFKRFFNAKVHSLVFDLGKGSVIREDEFT